MEFNTGSFLTKEQKELRKNRKLTDGGFPLNAIPEEAISEIEKLYSGKVSYHRYGERGGQNTQTIRLKYHDFVVYNPETRDFDKKPESHEGVYSKRFFSYRVDVVDGVAEVISIYCLHGAIYLTNKLGWW